jgi:hypothetical protein
MTLKDEFAALTGRIAKARADLAAWQAAGAQEKYFEAYSLVDALELQLAQLRQAGLAVNEDTTPMPAAAPAVREALMDELSISYSGRHYQYGRYRYDLLDDAVDYAKLQRSMPAVVDLEGSGPLSEQVDIPDASQRELMASLDISFVGGMYHFGPHRYDRLADAVNYARLRRASGQ